jgi:hypothetical protein
MYMSIVTTETWFVCSRILSTMCIVRICVLFVFVYDWQKNITFWTPIKKTLCSPGYSLVHAVKLSLQSGRNTQPRTCIILVIFSYFRNTTDIIVSNTKNDNIYDIILFEGLSFQNTLIRNYYALLFLLVPGQASQENLIVRQILGTSWQWAWQFHSPVLHIFLI